LDSFVARGSWLVLFTSFALLPAFTFRISQSEMRKRLSCRWMVALLAGVWFHGGSGPSLCGGTANRCLQMDALSVAGDHRSFAHRVSRRVRERRRQAPEHTSDGEARRLTSEITKAGSTSELLSLLEKPAENANLFNHFHMSASLTRLARFKRRGPFRQADVSSPVWAKLAARLLGMLRKDSLPTREAVNVLHAADELSEEMAKHVSQALPKLYEAIRAKASGMNAQHLSNSLLVLDAVPALAKRVPDKVEDMIPQALSNSLWAAAKLQDASPE
ncbi:unnamed protein product, partial [Symbiodinium necroappetens]